MSLTPSCTCPDPKICPHQHQLYPTIQYPYGPSSSNWAPQFGYSYPKFPPWAVPAVPSLNTHDFIPYQPSASSPSSSGQPAFRVALGETTSHSVNTTHSTRTGNKRKRPNTNSSNSQNHRRTTNTRDSNVTASPSSTIASVNQGILPAPAVHGVGPTTSTAPSGPSLPHPAFQSRIGRSIIEKGSNKSGKTSGASDVWYFVRGLHSQGRPTTLAETVPLSEKQPDPSKFIHLGCRLCQGPQWTTWKNVSGQTSAIRSHLKEKHYRTWRELVMLNQLKGWTDISKECPEDEREAFSLQGFYERLLRWIAVDDQSIDVVDSRELRDLLLFIGAELQDRDIPHRTKLSEMITSRFKIEHSKMVEEISNALGRIALTSDLWSRQNLESYMAMTAHFCAKSQKTGNLIIRSHLVAFRHVSGSHTGANIGQTFVRVLKEIGCLKNISLITMDNASNNNTMMQEVADELQVMGIPFDVDGNRIRCFPHVINISVKTGLKYLTDTSIFDPDISPTDPLFEATQALRDDVEYWQTLKNDVVGRARRLVAACRASGQRREDFKSIIVDGNENGSWGDAGLLRVIVLLRDVDTRWSSTFLMIDRVLELHLAINKFLEHEKHTEIAHLALGDTEIQVLSDIQQFLYVFHVVQEIVSAEKTPTLSLVLPLYEKLIALLTKLKIQLPKLEHAIAASVWKLEEYLEKSRQTKIYALAMVINPTIKFKWIEKHWSTAEYQCARKSVRDAMLDHRRAMRASGNASNHSNHTSSERNTTLAPTSKPGRRLFMPASRAASAQASGYARLNSLETLLSESASPISSNSSSALDVPSHPGTMEIDREADEHHTQEEDEVIVDQELREFEVDGIIEEGHPEFVDFDLLRYWQSKQGRYPILWRVALDVLPVQASAVACERVFSSGKETDSDRRSNLSPIIMEILQLLKYTFRQDRLSFTEDLVCSEEELSVIDFPKDRVEELFASGKIEELQSLIDASWSDTR